MVPNRTHGVRSRLSLGRCRATLPPGRPSIAVLGRENPSASGQCAAVTSTPRTIRFGEASVYVQGASLKTGAAP
jgi:hypothetical protein